MPVMTGSLLPGPADVIVVLDHVLEECGAGALWMGVLGVAVAADGALARDHKVLRVLQGGSPELQSSFLLDIRLQWGFIRHWRL